MINKSIQKQVHTQKTQPISDLIISIPLRKVQCPIIFKIRYAYTSLYSFNTFHYD